MEEKYKSGLANQAMVEFDNIKKLREEFIAAGAGNEHVCAIEDAMNELFGIYLELTKRKV